MVSRRNFLRSGAAVAAPLIGSQTAPPRKPNVLVFLVDDMGYGDIGAYGVKDIRTPNLDRLARQGVRFTQSYSNGPVCTPTRCALMTARYQQRAGLEWALLPTHREEGLPATEPSLPRLLKNQGYSTAMFGKWHLGVRPEHGPNAHGFDEFFGILGGNVDHYSHKNVNGTPDLFENTQAVQKTGYLTELITDRAVDFLARKRSDPFFLYVAYNSVHWPFQPPGKPADVRTRETWHDGDRTGYARMVESIDESAGRILTALDRGGFGSNTLVLFTNDNGGERFSRNEPLFHHKATLWEGGIRVPALLRWPGAAPAGRTLNQPVMTMDFAATILAAAGAAPPAGRTLDGIDLLPSIRDDRASPARTFFWRIDRVDRKQKAARQGKWKYMRDGAIEMLFDLDADPGERLDIAPRYPEKLAELRQSMGAWEADLARNPPAYSVK